MERIVEHEGYGYSIPSDYAKRMKKLRDRLGITQKDLASFMHVSLPLVKQWESGRVQPSLQEWQQIALAEVDGIYALRKDHNASPLLSESPADYELALDIDFSADPEQVRIVVEGERLTCGYLFNPAFATEISLIEPLPHQRIAVYDHMLQQSRLRFLLADDAGAGKTIMTGLYIREMLTRRLISRVLIVAPAGLVGNWEHELRTLFNLPFRIIIGSDARADNPFIGPECDLLIVSVDTLAGERMFARLQEADVQPYDLAVFDEAHKLAADREADFRMHKTDRYRLAESLAGILSDEARWALSWACHHLLLLTATPHMGKDFPYYCLWRLLEPDALATFDAFNAYPMDARRRHFIRRTKEELVYFDGRPIYPPRISNTLSYNLSQGEVSEQSLYDAATAYIRTYYNRAGILNRSAARLAMSVFQRRLASSTYALWRSFQRRHEKLAKLVEDMRAGRLDAAKLEKFQQKLNAVRDVYDEKTADEEEVSEGQEENERAEDEVMEGVLATTLAELEAELQQVTSLLDLARSVYELGEESKFEKLREILRDPRYQHEKMIIFTEHRDTLAFLVHRLQGLGFTEQIAQIHGGMNYQQREEQVAFFRRPVAEGGATYLVATDAAGEGINLQVCWLMVNYDIPWNPARLEQRMGRIHRFGQKHDSVYILNLVAGKTREGLVMKTLLEKMERIRRELGSDKVFDVIGQLFEGISLRAYMEKVVLQGNDTEVLRSLEGTLTEEQVKALQARDHVLFGDGGAVQRELPRLRENMDRENYRKLLPGYVRHYLEKAAPLVGIGIEGNLDHFFAFRPLQPGKLDWLLPLLEIYSPQQRNACTVYPPRNGEPAIFLHPGELLFDRFRSYLFARFARQSLHGAVFVDPTAERPSLFHLLSIEVFRQADPLLRPLNQQEVLEYRLVGLRQEANGEVTECPVEYLLLLHGASGQQASVIPFVAKIDTLCEIARTFVTETIAEQRAAHHRQTLLATLPTREDFIERGFQYQAAELADARTRFAEKASAGDAHAKGELTKIKARQRELAARKAEAIAIVRQEPELIAPGAIIFLAHAVILPTSDPVEKKRYDAEVEAIAMREARAFEEMQGAMVSDVSKAAGALAEGLSEWPGFDLLSRRPSGEKLAIEVKGRATIGDVELSENEWIRACNLGDSYWLYVVFDCAKSSPRLLRIQNPFSKLIVRTKQRVIIDEHAIFDAAESD